MIESRATVWNLHCTDGDMDCRAARLDGDHGIEETDSGLEWF